MNCKLIIQGSLYEERLHQILFVWLSCPSLHHFLFVPLTLLPSSFEVCQHGHIWSRQQILQTHTTKCNEIYFGSFSQLNESDIDNRIENYKCQYKRFTTNLLSSITKFNIYILGKVLLNHYQNTLHNRTETNSGWILDHHGSSWFVCQ